MIHECFITGGSVLRRVKSYRFINWVESRWLLKPQKNGQEKESLIMKAFVNAIDSVEAIAKKRFVGLLNSAMKRMFLGNRRRNRN